MPQSTFFSIQTVSNLEGIKRRAIRSAKEAKAMRAAATNTARRTRTLLRKTTTTWRHKVDFYISISARVGGDEVGFIIWTYDDVWHYLDRGTKRKPVLVSPDFVPKTEPYYYGSRPGSGHVFFPSSSQIQNRDYSWSGGIPARNWSTARFFRAFVQRELLKDMQIQMDKLVKEING